MIKRPSRNFKVPLVWAGPKDKEQITERWDPISKRLVRVNCCSAIPASYEFVRIGTAGNPGSGNFSILSHSLTNVYLRLNSTDKNGQNATSLLTTLKTSTYIKVQKDISNYQILTVLSYVDFVGYSRFDCIISSSVGTVSTGDTATISPL